MIVTVIWVPAQAYYAQYSQLAQQQSARMTQLPNYVVTGSVNTPSGGVQAPPQGVVMQFPGSQVFSQHIARVA
jgi:hypothetical protein